MASEEAKRLRDRRLNVWNEAKGLLDKASEENRTMTPDEDKRFNACNDEVSALDARIKSVLDAETRAAEADSAFAQLEERQAKSGLNPLGSTLFVSPDVQRWTEVRNGDSVVDVVRQSRGQIHTRSLLSIGNSASATVPVDFYDQLLSYLIEVSGILQTGPTVLNTAGGETIQIPTVAAHPTAATAAQGGVIPSGDPSFAQKTLGSQKFGWQGSLSRELIDDTAIDLLGYLAMAAGRDLGNKFGSALLLGGNGITGGLVPAVTTTVTGAATGSIATAQGQVIGGPSYGNLVDLEYSVIAPYRQSRSCYWLMSDQSIGQLRKLTDTVGRPIWEPSSVLGSPDLLFGKPLVADPFMAAFGHSNVSILFGDFSQYFVRLVGGLRFERSDDFQFGNDLVTFRALLRGDGNLSDVNAIKAFVGG